MGLFDFLKGKNGTTSTSSNVNVEPTPSPVSVAPTNGLLDLRKNDILDLTKYSDKLRNVRAAAGWAINERGRDYDLDLCAYLCDSKGSVLHTVYYGDKDYAGIYLDGDDLTGGGDKDNENIRVDFNNIPKNVQTIYFAVVIYEAESRHQVFGKVKNAYIRLVDSDARDYEICRFSITDDGGDNSALLAAKLTRTGDAWSFGAIGTYSKDSIRSLRNKINNKKGR